jgi:hypothetical protein
MKGIFLIMILLVLGATAVTAVNDFCGIKNTTLRAGEQIVYKAYYHWGAMNVGAGEATFNTTLETLNNKPVYHIVGDGKTYKTYDWFFKVRDKYETYIDTVTMLPLKFVRNVNEGGFRIYNNVLFNHKGGSAVSTTKVVKINPCVQDVLSTIYYARNINFDKYKPGDKIPFEMFIDDEVYSLAIKYVGKEILTTSLGKFKTVKFMPTLIKGTLFKGGEGMTVWATDDLNHIPIRVESPITVGDVRIDLIKAKNLSHNLTSKIK